MKTGWKKTIAPLVLVLGAVALAACGGSDNKTTAVQFGGRHGCRRRPGRDTLIIGTDLPLQGASADASADTNLAIKLLLEKIGNKAGNYNVDLKEYDDSTAAKGAWDDATCTANANAHVTNKAEVAVMGTYNSGCAKLEVPILNQDPSGPMLMISHANTNPGLTKAWDPGEPEKYYPTGTRTTAASSPPTTSRARPARSSPPRSSASRTATSSTTTQTYGQGVAKAFVDAGHRAWASPSSPTTRGTPSSPTTRRCSRRSSAKNPDCVFLGGIYDNNGRPAGQGQGQGPRRQHRRVKLIGPDGFTGYPDLRQAGRKPRACTISFAGLAIERAREAGRRRRPSS